MRPVPLSVKTLIRCLVLILLLMGSAHPDDPVRKGVVVGFPQSRIAKANRVPVGVD